MAKGLTNDEIGGALGLATGTVRTHVSAIFRALSVTNRTEATSLFEQRARDDERARFFERPAVAVLPLTVHGAHGNDERTLAAGVSDDLIRLLSRHAWFPVIARSSSIDGGPLPKGAAQIGEALGARYLVGGVVYRARRLTISITVEDAKRNIVLWADRAELDDEDLHEETTRVVTEMVRRLYPEILRASAEEIAELPPESMTAWQLTQLGWLQRASRSRASHLEARSSFERAITLSPRFMLAHYGRGVTAFQDQLNLWSSPGEASTVVEESLQVCAELAPEHAETRFLAGRARQMLGDHVGAGQEYRAACDFNPSFAEAYATLGTMEALEERYDRAMEIMKRAARLSPRAFVSGLACVTLIVGKREQALKLVEQALERHPTYAFARMLAVAAAFELGDRSLAEAHYRRLQEDQPGFTAEQVWQQYPGARQGPGARLIEALAQVEASATRS